MSHTERLRRSPNAFRQLRAITPAAFDRLLADLTHRHEHTEAECKYRPDLRRRLGAGRKHALSLADRLLMLLIYYRTYTTHAILGFLFGVDDSTVCRNINPLQPMMPQGDVLPQSPIASSLSSAAGMSVGLFQKKEFQGMDVNPRRRYAH